MLTCPTCLSPDLVRRPPVVADPASITQRLHALRTDAGALLATIDELPPGEVREDLSMMVGAAEEYLRDAAVCAREAGR